MENQTQTTNEDTIDTSSFMKNDPITVVADHLYSKLFEPVLNFFDRIHQKLTGRWVEKELENILELEAAEITLGLEAQEYRKNREAEEMKDLTRPL